MARDPLRHVVLLKQLLAYPGHVQAYRSSSPAGSAILLALEASASAYDRQTYPEADIVAFVASDHPDLTAALLPCLPRDVGIVFKLSCEADLPPVRTKFSVVRRTAFVSFTADSAAAADAEVRLTTRPGETAFRLFESQGHERSWVEAMLAGDRAFACVLERAGDTASVCLVYENWGPVWEVGGVVTAPDYRRKGLGARVVRTALAELGRRGLKPRYQVEEHNVASIALARSVGLAPFLTIAHHLAAG
ncbi:MAG TPA: GNAT family N-acetyltransferase [Reyranella sp.]|nr:GNAT family N-acetyltransferase [Reyranella sp.]